MSDFTLVKFTAIDHEFNVPSVLVDGLFGTDIQIKCYGAIIAFGFALAVLFGGRMYTDRYLIYKNNHAIAQSTCCSTYSKDIPRIKTIR